MATPPSDEPPEEAEEASAPPVEVSPPASVLPPVSARIARISREPDTYTGPPPPIHPISEEIARIASGEEKPEAPTKPPPPPPRRQTMEVQMAWLEVRGNEPKVEQVPAPVASDAQAKDEPEFPDDEAPTTLRKKPPRLPGARRTLPPMPLGNQPTKPPPPRRATQEVEMSWVELVDDDLVEEPPSVPDVPSDPDLPPSTPDVSAPARPPPPVPERAELPKLYDEAEPREITRVESAPVSTQRIEAEKKVALAEAQAQDHLEGPPISDTVRELRLKDAQATAKLPRIELPQSTAKLPRVDDRALAAEAAKRERLSQFLQAVSASIPPGALNVSDLAASENEADLDKMREEALAARKREQDARDREIREKRRAERERERLELEAKQARREQEKRDEEERAAALRTGTPDKQLLDLSGIDDEIDNALDAILGPNLSYPPPPPDDEKS